MSDFLSIFSDLAILHFLTRLSLFSATRNNSPSRSRPKWPRLVLTYNCLSYLALYSGQTPEPRVDQQRCKHPACHFVILFSVDPCVHNKPRRQTVFAVPDELCARKAHSTQKLIDYWGQKPNSQVRTFVYSSDLGNHFSGRLKKNSDV